MRNLTRGFHGTGRDTIELQNKGGQTMSIIRLEDVIAWKHRGQILCLTCGDDEYAPLTEEDVEDNCIIICDRCGKRINVRI